MTVRSPRLVGASLAAIALTAVSVFGLAASAQAAITPGATITTPVNQIEDPYTSDVTSDGKIMAIPSNDDDTVTFVFAETDTQVLVTDSGGVIDEPIGVAFSPDNATLYVANYGTNSIVVIDVATHAVVDTITTINSENLGIGVSPDGTKLIVADDYDNVTIFDITNSYAQLATNSSDGSYIMNFFFIDNDTVYSTDYDGVLEKWSLSDASQLASFTPRVMQSYGQCATSDLSTIYFISNLAVPSEVIAVNPVDGSIVGDLDLENVAVGDGLCAVTPDDKKLLLSDWDQQTPGQVFIIDLAGLTLQETVTFSDLEYTDAIGIMAGCKVFVTGYYQNIGQFQLPVEYCSLSLPDTGASPSVIGTSIAVSVGLLVAGAIALVVVRRRQHS